MSQQLKRWLIDLFGFIIAVIVIVNISVAFIGHSNMKVGLTIAISKDKE